MCPKYKSADIEKNFNVLIAAGAPQQWKCNKCGFTSYLFPGIVIKKSKKKQQK